MLVGKDTGQKSTMLYQKGPSYTKKRHKLYKKDTSYIKKIQARPKGNKLYQKGNKYK